MSLYDKFYRYILWSGYEKLRGRQSHQLLRDAETRQYWPADRLRDWQWQETIKLIHHAYEHTAWYRSRFEALGLKPGDIRSLADFHLLPPLSKDDIRQHCESLLADNYREKVIKHNTGGTTTGTALQFYITRASFEWRNAITARGYGWAGCHDGDRQFYVFGAPVTPPPWKQRLKIKVDNALRQRTMFNCFFFSEAAMVDCARRINVFRPTTIIGYTNPLYLLAQHIIENKKPSVSPQAVITAAEGVNSVQRRTIEQAFGAPVFVSYGSREFKLIAMECEQHNGLHFSADNLLIEVMAGDRPAKDGEIGEILVTDLHNYGMPFIRYRIGDLGVPTQRACPCGRGLPLLQRVEGRVLDAIRTPDGRIVPGEFFVYVIKEFYAVKQYQVIQKKRDTVQIKLVLREDAHLDQLQRMKQEIMLVLGNAITVSFEQVSDIPLTASGKFRVTISELPPT